VCVVFSRNNGYAISTPTRDQYRGDGIGTFLLSVLLIVIARLLAAAFSIAVYMHRNFPVAAVHVWNRLSWLHRPYNFSAVA